MYFYRSSGSFSAANRGSGSQPWVVYLSNEGDVVRSEYCGFRTLAYPIKKNHKGHYYIMQIKTSASVVSELDRTMRINEDIIRFLIVRVEKFDGRDNLITQTKAFVDEFGSMTKDKGYRLFKSSAESNAIDQAGKVNVAVAE